MRNRNIYSLIVAASQVSITANTENIVSNTRGVDSTSDNLDSFQITKIAHIKLDNAPSAKSNLIAFIFIFILSFCYL